MSIDISINQITKKYHEVTALRDISFDIPTGQLVAIIGPNGSGKSTLMKLLTGIESPTSGTLTIAGKKPKDAGSLIGYVPQRFHIDRDLPLTVREFLDLALCNTKHHRHSTTIMSALSRVGMESYQSAQVGTLSGGELQRILIARAMLHERSILILDEPEASIDIERELELYSNIHAINKEFGTTVLIVSHELETVMKHVDRVIGINGGVVFDATPKEISEDNTLITKLYHHPTMTTCKYC